MSVTKTLFPPANREAAVVAFLRTFWQVVRATGFLGGAGIITVNATQVAHIDLQLLGYAAAAVLISGILSGLISSGDILVHGLPDAYTSNAVATVPAAILTPSPDPQIPATPIMADPGVPVAPVVDPALPAVVDPAAPAAAV